jgi:phosphoribosylformylglycinamidine cyclo-ligase
MNLDDMIACGATGPFTYAQIINRNKNLIKQEIIDEVINGAQEFFNRMKQFGIDITFTGGETADLGDTVRTLTVDGVMTARMRRDDIVHIDIKPGDYIVGLASAGQSAYESTYNSGIGSNGFTDARHDLLKKEFAIDYPESFDPFTPEELIYRGRHDFKAVGVNSTKNMLLSPTRTYAPVIRDILSREVRKHVSGIIHCSGGGQTKVLNFVDNIRIEKDNMFPVPDIFKLIQKESGKDTAGMLSTYNMGSRMEIYVRNKKAFDQIEFLAVSYGIEAKIIGKCLKKENGAEVAITLPDRERVVIAKNPSNTK